MAFKLRSGFLKAGGFKQMGAAPAPSPVKKTYGEAWDAMPQAKKDTYADKADFVNQAKRYNQKKYGTTDPTKKAEKLTGGDKKELAEVMKPKKMEAKTTETPKKEMKMETRKAPEPQEKSGRAKREDKRMEAKGKRQENRDNRKANKRKPETLKAKPGSAADTKGKMTKTVKPADKKVDPKTMKVGKREGDKVSYVRKSAADAPGAKGNQKKDYATPASETKAGKAAADRKALAEKRAGQTKGQARRDAKKSADYKTNDRQERKNIRDEAEAMSGGSKRDVRKANKASKDTGKMTKTVKAANKPEEFKKSIDPKTPMTKYAKPSPKKNYKKGYYGA